MVDVEARCRHSAQRRGDGEERHSQGVVTACITCCHEKHSWPDHAYGNKSLMVNTSSEVQDRLYCRGSQPFVNEGPILSEDHLPK